jgi:hypothetical protein
MTTSSEPALAAPGAGLPAIELFIGRLLFRLNCRAGSREEFISRFQKERSAIRMLVEGCEESQCGERILIRRLRGLEDSSRYWSVFMTLDHLRITNLAFAGVIRGLTHGRVPEGEASTAAVKPDPLVTSGVVEEYEKSCDLLLSVITKSGELKTTLRYPHPWFGPLNAFEWLALAAMHLGIHRAQIEAILKGLPTRSGL